MSEKFFYRENPVTSQRVSLETPSILASSIAEPIQIRKIAP